MIKSLSWTLSGNIIYAASQWGVLIILSRLGSPETVGKFSLALSITAPVILFFNLDLRNIQATDANTKFNFNDYLGLRIRTTIIAFIFIIIITLIMSSSLESKLVVVIIALSKSFESISDVIYGFMQYQNRMDIIAKSIIIKGVSSLVVVLFVFSITKNLALSMLALSFVWGFIMLKHDLYNAIKIINEQNTNFNHFENIEYHKLFFFKNQDVRTDIKLIKIAWPLGIVSTITSVIINVPKYMISYFLGDKQLGIFTNLSSLMLIGSTVSVAASQVAIPKLAKYFANRNFRDFLKLSTRVFLSGIAIGVISVTICMFKGDFLLDFIFGHEYEGYGIVLVNLMIGATFAYGLWFMSPTMTAVGQFSIQLPLFIGVLVVAIISSYYLIPTSGLVGAANSFTYSVLAQGIGSLLIVLWTLGRYKNM
jgi:O-antigen/teichoic acid export membrane protein